MKLSGIHWPEVLEVRIRGLVCKVRNANLRRPWPDSVGGNPRHEVRALGLACKVGNANLWKKEKDALTFEGAESEELGGGLRFAFPT